MDNYARQIDVHEGGDDGDVARNCKKERFNEIPKKMIILSGALFLIGLSLVSVGVYCFFNCAHSLGLFVIGFIALCPGAYSMFILVSYVCGVPGFHWHQLPDME
jgi:uncharacterized membrane-anchored protein